MKGKSCSYQKLRYVAKLPRTRDEIKRECWYFLACDAGSRKKEGDRKCTRNLGGLFVFEMPKVFRGTLLCSHDRSISFANKETEKMREDEIVKKDDAGLVIS